MSVQIEDDYDDEYLGFPLAQDNPPEVEDPPEEPAPRPVSQYNPLKIREPSYNQYWKEHFRPSTCGFFPEIPLLRDASRDDLADFEFLKSTLIKSVSSIGSFTYHPEKLLITFQPLMRSQPRIQIYLDDMSYVHFYVGDERYFIPNLCSLSSGSVSFIMRELTRPDGKPIPYELAATYRNFRSFHNKLKAYLEEMVEVFNANHNFGHFLVLDERDESMLSYNEFLHSYSVFHYKAGMCTQVAKVVIAENGRVHYVDKSGCWTFEIDDQIALSFARRMAASLGF